MDTFYVIANVGKHSYATKIEARNASHAEHQIIDLGYTGRHEYGVEGCCAYDLESMQTDTFASAMYHAEPVSLAELSEIINERNAEIQLQEQKEDEKERILKTIQKYRDRIEELENDLERMEVDV